MLQNVSSDDEIKEFGKMKVKLIKYHQQFAKKLGLVDCVVDNYSYEDAIRYIGKKDYYQFLIRNDKDGNIGILEYQITESDIDKNKVIYIKDLYIDEKYRGNGIATEVINELKNKGYRIELECWYEMPANNLYKKLGMKEIKTRYMLN